MICLLPFQLTGPLPRSQWPQCPSLPMPNTGAEMGAPRQTAPQTALLPAWDWSPRAFWGVAVARGQSHWVSPCFGTAVPGKAEGAWGANWSTRPFLPRPLLFFAPCPWGPLHRDRRAGCVAHLTENVSGGWLDSGIAEWETPMTVQKESHRVGGVLSPLSWSS